MADTTDGTKTHSACHRPHIPPSLVWSVIVQAAVVVGWISMDWQRGIDQGNRLERIENKVDQLYMKGVRP